MILSAIGRTFNSWFTSEYSCSGPRTSSGLYVVGGLSLFLFSVNLRCEYYV